MPLADPGRVALQSLLAPGAGPRDGGLPNLRHLLSRVLVAEPADVGPETSLSPPHERALARALGWSAGDGRLPMAAWQAADDGIDGGIDGTASDLAWGLLTPVQWHVGTEQVGLVDPQSLMLDAAESRALFEAVKPLFVSEGFVSVWGAPLRWYLAHESLADLATASLDRVIGRNVDVWLGAARDQPALKRLHRLQAEMQMLLYRHPLTESRQARGLPAVNSFWLSGCGVAQPSLATSPSLETALRRDALAGDWAAWAKAFEQFDASGLADAAAAVARGEALSLVLCGERGARRFATPARPPGLWDRLQRRLAPPEPWSFLEPL